MYDLPVRGLRWNIVRVAPHLSHGLGVPSREVVVGSDDQHGALTGQGVEVAGQRGYERLPFPGGHLRELALVQG